MKRYLFFLFLLLLSVGGVNAQKKQGRALIDSLLTELPKPQKDTVKLDVLYDLSFEYSFINPDTGIMYGMQELTMATKLNRQYGVAGAYNGLGVNFIAKGNYQKGREYYLMAMAINEESGNKKGVIANLDNLGVASQLQSNFPEALEYYFKSLKIAEETGDKDRMGTMIGNIGVVYHDQGNLPKALEYYFKSLNICEQTGAKTGIGNALGNIALIYKEQKDDTKALEYSLKALKIEEELGAKTDIGIDLETIGDIYQSRGDYHRALENFYKALSIYTSSDDLSGIASDLANLAVCYLTIVKDTTMTGLSHKGSADSLIPAGKPANLHRAVDFLNRAISINKEDGNLNGLQDCLERLSEAQRLMGNSDGALESYMQFVAAKDSVFNMESKIKIANLETQREVELKDKQIELDKLAVAKKRNERGFFIAGILLLLGIISIVFRNYKVQKRTNGLLLVAKQKVDERTKELDITNEELNATLMHLKETQQQLIATEKQKENEMIRSRIAMDIHDDVSSELTRISWVSELAKLKFKKADVAELPALLDKITGTSRHTIDKLKEIIWTVNPANDNIESFVAQVRVYVSRFFNDTSFEHTIDFPENVPRLPINPELTRNLFLVLKEALNNAVKYSKATHISVSFSLSGSNYLFTIADDGVGIDENIVHGGGNGLKNMRSRMRDIKGSCTIDSRAGAGTKLVFEGVLY